MRRQLVDFLTKEHRRRSLNYDSAITSLRAAPPPFEAGNRIRIHKRNSRDALPKLSIILLDWSCRERFDSLEWLEQQDVPREAYELIWVELFDRVIREAMERADVVVTCGQSNPYHKHEGYNIGLLLAQGELFCVCDSDAVFPQEFVRSIFDHFYGEGKLPRGSVLFHFEGRSSLSYPGLHSAQELKDASWRWWGLHPNVGACMTVRTADAIRFGGFDEDPVYAGYLCGPYELGWRLMNAGLAEVWHDPATKLWHFAHPDPVGDNGILPSLRQIGEITYPHVDLHALHAVEALVCGRLLPLQENAALFERRMSSRVFGAAFVTRYAFSGGPAGFRKGSVRKMRRASQLEDLRIRAARLVVRMIEGVCTVLRPELVAFTRRRRNWKPAAPVFSAAGWVLYVQGEEIFALPHYVDPHAPESKALRIIGGDFWSVQNAILEQAPALCYQPEIIDKDYRGTGFQTVAFLSLVIGIRSGQGRFDLGRLLLDPPNGTYWCTTVAAARQMVDRAQAPTTPESRREMFLNAVDGLLDGFPGVPPNTPILLASLFDTSLVYVANELLAVPRAVGQFDLTNSLGRETPGSRRVSSRIELSKLVDDQLRAARVVSAGAASE